MERADKIALLKDIQCGKKSVSEILEAPVMNPISREIVDAIIAMCDKRPILVIDVQAMNKGIYDPGPAYKQWKAELDQLIERLRAKYPDHFVNPK